MTGVDVGEGAGDPVGGEAGVIPLRTCVRVLAAAANFPGEVGRRVVGELAEAGVEGAVALALVTSTELDLVDGNVAAVAPDLGGLGHGDRLHDDGVLLGVGVHHLGLLPGFAGGVHQCCKHNISEKRNFLQKQQKINQH